MLRRLRQKGGKVVLSHPQPQISATSSAGAIQNAISTQKTMNNNMSTLNRELAGGGVVVPQLDQAGSVGNNLIAGTIQNANQAASDAEYDNNVIDPDNVTINNGMPGGGKKRKKKNKRRKKRKTRKLKGGHHLYKRLGVSKYASKKSIKKAFKKLKKQKKLTKKIKYAFKILSNNKSRKAYNKRYRK